PHRAGAKASNWPAPAGIAGERPRPSRQLAAAIEPTIHPSRGPALARSNGCRFAPPLYQPKPKTQQAPWSSRPDGASLPDPKERVMALLKNLLGNDAKDREDVRATLDELKHERTLGEQLLHSLNAAADRLQQLGKPIEQAGSDVDSMTTRLAEIEERFV